MVLMVKLLGVSMLSIMFTSAYIVIFNSLERRPTLWFSLLLLIGLVISVIVVILLGHIVFKLLKTV